MGLEEEVALWRDCRWTLEPRLAIESSFVLHLRRIATFLADILPWNRSNEDLRNLSRLCHVAQHPQSKMDFLNSLSGSTSSENMFESLKQTADLPPRVVLHLKNVYSFLAGMLSAATLACYLSVARIFTLGPGWNLLGSMALMFGFAWVGLGAL